MAPLNAVSEYLSMVDLTRINAVIFADLAARNSPASRVIASAAEARLSLGFAPVRPSERSFDSQRLDREAAEPDPCGHGSSRKTEASPLGEREATLH